MSTTTATDTTTPVPMTRLVTYGLLAIIGASVVNVLIRAMAVSLFNVPTGVGPFRVQPVVTTTIIGVVGAICVYGILSRVSQYPIRAFLWVGAVVLALSFVPLIVPPVFLAEAPASVLWTLALMHVTTAGIALGAVARTRHTDESSSS